MGGGSLEGSVACGPPICHGRKRNPFKGGRGKLTERGFRGELYSMRERASNSQQGGENEFGGGRPVINNKILWGPNLKKKETQEEKEKKGSKIIVAPVAGGRKRILLCIGEDRSQGSRYFPEVEGGGTKGDRKNKSVKTGVYTSILGKLTFKR